MAGLIVVDVIHVVTPLGGCDIDLCIGDIVKLPVEEKVDVVVVSAFRGNYRPTVTSLIGGLKRGLGIDVFKLAENKAEDLRDIHHCWWSQRLPDDLPFKRLMCFEAKYAGFSRPQELVGDVFRCLIPILNNQDGSVITPLLNTGDQGFDKAKMMISMVEAAVNWMKAGLPLRKLKIVLYAHKVDDRESLITKNKKICELFETLKEKYGMKDLIQKNIPIEYDVYLSSSKEDEGLATIIQEELKLAKPDIRIFGNKQELNKDEVWQEDMYEVMIRCTRVISVLTPQYLRSTSCMEQYNMALCCNRTAERDMLAPFYAEPVEQMPTYMGLVQYVDCLEKDTDKISTACKQLSSMLDVTVHAEVVYKRPKLEYDVFISYCHRNADKAAKVVEKVKKLDAHWKVFFDTEELKTGATWQQMLYHAIDDTKCFVAVITKEYLKSPVCQEEFNLALSKHYQQSDQLIMVPLLVDDDLHDLPLEFKQIQLVNATGELFPPAIEETCTAIFRHLKGKKPNMHSLFTKPNVSPNVQNIQEELRRSKLNEKYQFAKNWGNTKFPPDFENFYIKEEKAGNNEDHKKSEKEEFTQEMNEKIAEGADVENSLNEDGTLTKEEYTAVEDVQEENKVSFVSKNKSNDNSNQFKCDVAISCTKNDFKYATYFIKLVKIFAPNLVIGRSDYSDQEKRAVLENASKIVVFVSPSYIESPSHMEELNIALCRHRFNPKSVLFAIQLHPLPMHPSYVHLILYQYCLVDGIWKEIVKKLESHKAEIHQLILTTRKLMDHDVRVSLEAAIGLAIAAGDVIKDIKDDRVAMESSCPRSVLENIGRIESDINDLKAVEVDEPVFSKMLYTIKLPIKCEIDEKKTAKLEENTNKSNCKKSGYKTKKDNIGATSGGWNSVCNIL